MPEWVLKDMDDFIRPRPKDLTPDPAKFNPLLVARDDPYEHLYTGTERFKYDYKGGPILGVNPYVALKFVTNHLTLREQLGSDRPTLDKMFEVFSKMIDPGTSLAQLDEEAKSSSSKMANLLTACGSDYMAGKAILKEHILSTRRLHMAVLRTMRQVLIAYLSGIQKQ